MGSRTEANRPGLPDPSEAAALVLRVAATALPVSLVALVALDPAGAWRIAAQSGPGAPLPRTALADLDLQGAAPLPRAVTIPDPSGHPRIGMLVDLGQFGLLLAIGADPSSPPAPHHVAILMDLARLASLSAAPAAPQPVEGTTLALTDALEALPEAIAIFDDDDRFVYWNSHFERVYAGGHLQLRRGRRFEDHLRASVATGHVIAALGREEEWLAERLARFHLAEGAHEHQLGDGRWVRVQDRRLPHGGKIGIRTDISELVEREQSFRLLFDANPMPMLVIDRESLAILAVNDAAVRFYGYARAAFLTLRLPCIRPEKEPGEIMAIIDGLDGPGYAVVTRRHVTAAGEDRLVKVSATSLNHAGRPAVLAAIFDVTEQQRSEDEVRRTRSFLREVVDNVPAAVFVKDMWDEGRYLVYNRAGEAMVDRPRSSIIGRSDREVFEASDAERFIQQDWTAMRLGSSGMIDEEVMHRPDGSLRWIRTRKVALPDGHEDRPRYVLGVSEDITDRRASEARIAHMAHHDALTGLPNRLLLCDRLESALARLHGSTDHLALLCIDLDGFKAINDAFGHATGDSLLQSVGERLREAVRSSDTAARLGGDEFVVLQMPLAQIGEAAWLAGRLKRLLTRPYRFDGHDLRIGASIGIALAPRDGLDALALLARADAALYQAKREGRNRFRFADPPDTATAAGTGPMARRPAALNE